MVDADPLELADPDVVPDEHHDGAKDGEHNAEDAARGRDRERRIGDRDRDRAPGRDRGRGEGAGFGVDVDDTRVRFSEEDKHGRREEDGDNGAGALGEPLLVWRGAEEEANAEVGDEVGGLVRADGADGAAEQIKSLRLARGPVFALGGAAKDDLGSLGCGGERSDIWYGMLAGAIQIVSSHVDERTSNTSALNCKE